MTARLFRMELRLLLRAPSCAVLAVLMLLALCWGAANGARHVRAQQATIERIDQHVRGKVAADQAALARWRASAGPRLPYWQDPSDPAGYMRYGLHAYAVKAPAPLAAVAVGQSRLLPYYLRVDLDYVAPPAAAFDFVSPRLLGLGEVDLAFLLVYIWPLAVIALGATRLAAERDSGALALIAAQARSLRLLVLGKFAALATVCVPFVLAATALALVLAGTSLRAAPAALALLAVALAGYTLFWVALASFVASRNGVVGSSLRLVGAWIALAFLLPAAAALLVDLGRTPAPALAYLDALRRANDVAPARRDALFKDYVASRPAYHGALARVAAVPYATKQIAVQMAAERKAAASVARRRAQAGARAAALQWLSPVLVVDGLLQRMAGTGIERHEAFLRDADDYTNRLRAFFWPRALQAAAAPAEHCAGCAVRLAFTEHDAIPRYQPVRSAGGPAPAPIDGALASYPWLLAAILVALMGLGRRGPLP
ncbi:DUF3526 domain-containing protein [Pseudoduganella chitinolytica]|uniref:DUF3526 domain-containing protein n=1 Tax=Pseudoduganella chitinolytica TaxID=34070 RepID=A0ABY8BCR5_9BURK|nr:DUF3526 domain-containing protein [Pseudoduganella chitinolytica]WEF33702.1 DUF3526 domain-containing protein [Pseudoduganella chitinolytica]